MTRTRREGNVLTPRKPHQAAGRRPGRANRLGNFEALESRSYLAAHIAGDPTAYATIQAAVNAAAPGATINVDAGNYAELVTINKTLTLRGAQAGNDARTNSRGTGNESIITGTTTTDGITSAFYVNANDVTIDGFTVTGNTSNQKYGAGIVIAPSRAGTRIYNNIVSNNVSGLFLSNNSASDAAIIQHNVFRDNNNAGENGGRGIYTDGTVSGGKLTNVTINENVFYNNRGGAGSSTYESGIGIEGRIAAAGSQTNIRITNNTFDNNGKAVMAWNASGLTITGNVVTHELDQWSGALRFEGGTNNVTIQNNTVYDNTGPAIRIDSKGFGDTNYAFTITGNNFFGNSSVWTNKESVVVAGGGQYDGPLNLTSNWWGSATGPGGIGAGTGDVVTGNGNNITFSPWLTGAAVNPQTAYWGAASSDGAPIQVEDFDHGGEGVAYHDLDATNNGKQYRPSEGVDLTVVTDPGGGYQASGAKAGEWIAYSVNLSQTAAYDIAIRCASSQPTASSFHVEVDGINVTGAITLAPTGGSWQTLTRSGINLTAGSHIVKLVFDTNGSSGSVGSFNWFQLTAAGSSPVPVSPSLLSANPVTPTSVALNWRDNSTNETAFVIERKTGVNGVWTSLATVGTDITDYTDTTASPSTTYSYRVHATNAAGDSGISNEASATTDSATPATYLSDLAWASAVNGWGPVERNLSNGSSGSGDGGVITLNGTTYAKGLGVHAGADITYNLNGNYSTFLSDVGVDDEEVNDGSIDFQVFADGVKIFDSGVMRPNSATQSLNLNVTGVRSLRLVVTDGGDGMDYDHGDWAGARLLSSAPTLGTPTNLASTATAPTQVKLTWVDNAVGETGYKVERSSDGGATYTQLALLAGDSTSYIDTTASAGANYSYRVRASGTSGDSNYSNVAAITTPTATGVTYLSDMQWESASNGWGPVERDMTVGGQAAGDGQTLKLNGVTYAKGLGTNAVSEIVYNLNGGYGQFSADVGVDDKQTVNGSVQFKVYADGVKVYDSGVMGPNSPTQHIALSMTGVNVLRLVADDGDDGADYDHADWADAKLTPAAPAAPGGVIATARNQTVNLGWTAAANGAVDSYRIERSTDSVTFTLLTTVNGSATTYADSATTASTTYSYRIAAVNAGGTSAYSTIVSATTAAAPVQNLLAPAAINSGNPTTSSTTHTVPSAQLPLPSGWSSADIGAATGGTASYSDGAYLLSGSGTDIGGTADAFQFAYRQLSGDGTIIAHLSNVQSSDPAAKAGLMIRNGLGSGAKEASVLVSPNGKASLVSRAKDSAASKVSAKRVTTPTWLKLVRKGKKITAYSSTDGKKWKSLGAMSVTMDKTVYVGLAVTAHQPSVATTAIDKVSVF